MVCGQWRAFASIRLALQQQMNRGPVRIVVERPPLIHRHVLVILHVGDQLGAFRGHDGAQLLDEDFGRRFHLSSHGNSAARVELALVSSGK